MKQHLAASSNSFSCVCVCVCVCVCTVCLCTYVCVSVDDKVYKQLQTTQCVNLIKGKVQIRVRLPLSEVLDELRVKIPQVHGERHRLAVTDTLPFSSIL